MQWISLVDFDALDHSSLRLVPALFDCFRNIREENPYYGRMKGIYRYYSFKNTLLFAKARVIFKDLIDAKIEFVIFKGAALALKYYKNHLIRPMGDIDLLVHEADILQTEKILTNNGFSYRYAIARRQNFNEHSFDYIDKQENGFDIHRYSLYESLVPGIDHEIWQRARELNWDGLSIKVMAPEDLILTSCINGLRDFPVQYHWILDVIKMIQAEPDVSWINILDEARKRKLAEQLFDALNLIHSISPLSMPATLINKLLAKDEKYRQICFNALISEGRTHNINKDYIKSGFADKPRFALPFAKKWDYNNKVPKHIRYFLDEDNHISLLYLHYRYLPSIEHAFEISDQEVFKQIIRRYPKSGAGYIKLPPALLKLKTNHRPSAYRATIKIQNKKDLLGLRTAEMKKIKLTVRNKSSCIWVSPNNPDQKYGVTYHLLSSTGELLAWGTNPRTYFLAARKSYITFMEQQELETELVIQGPLEPGNYIIQLDIMHENVAWYSQQGNKFPSLKIQVRPSIT